MSLTLRARAKLNLYLHIQGRRADGYHELSSLVAFTELADELRIEPADTLSLTTQGEFASAAGDNHENLVIRAAQALQKHTNTSRGAKLTLTKNIPVGAGLGGGSSDAAAALNGLNQFWQLGLSTNELHSLAVKLGADVTMCLDPIPAEVSGIGEVLAPLRTPLPSMAVLLVHPRAPLLTKDVYAALNKPQKHTDSIALNGTNIKDFVSQLQKTRNHLQPAAIAVNPLVTEVLLALETALPTPELVRMSGSGACCFALYSTPEEASRAGGNINRDHPNWWVHATRIIGN